MKRRLQSLWTWCLGHAEDLLATVAFVAIALGFALAWLPLGFIVPGAIIFGALVWKRVK